MEHLANSGKSWTGLTVEDKCVWAATLNMEKYIPVIFLDKIILSSDDRCRTGKDNQLLWQETLWPWVKSPATEDGDTGKCLVFYHWQRHLGIQVFWNEFPGISAIDFTWTKPSFSKGKAGGRVQTLFPYKQLPVGLPTGDRGEKVATYLSSVLWRSFSI